MSDVVSIHDNKDRLVGSGVVVTDDLIITCAHVVNSALGRLEHQGCRPEAHELVKIRFNGAPSDDPYQACVDSAPAAWSRPPAELEAGADLCVLRLTNKPPSGVVPARIRAQRFRGAFQACASGYPNDWNNKASSPRLDVGNCKVMEQAGYLWLVRGDDVSRLGALHKKARIAGQIYIGFSGGPLKKEEYLVGLMALARPDPADATAYAIPAVYFPEYVLSSAQALSDANVSFTATELSAVAERELQSSGKKIASIGGDAAEKDSNAGLAPAEDDLAEQLIASYSTIFVGRSKEAERIRSFIGSEQSGYLFVKGEPGAGKTALLAHLVQEFRMRDARPGVPFLIYHFIRQDQGDLLRVLSSLNAQLAKALGEISSYVALPNLEAQFKALWSRLMLRASHERPALLVVDGLDELEEPASLGRWLPAKLAPYAHVLASGRTIFDPYRCLPMLHVARSAGPPIVLAPLERNDVERLLELQLENPAAAARLVEPVFRVTNGFALKARLLAKDIAENGEAVLQDEARQGALLRDYLGEEARHLTEGEPGSLRRRVLAILAEARGPLTPDDLRDILLQPDQAEMDRALRTVIRCLASPVNLDFMHLELKRAVANRVTTEEKDAAHAALSCWMQSAAEAVSAAHIPAYVLDHFVDEFRTRDLKALTSTIVSERWRSSRYARRGSHADYINDLDKIREQAAGTQPDWQIFCQVSYIRAQLHTVASALPLSVLQLLADLDRIEEANVYAMLQPNPLSRVWALTRLSLRYRQQGNGDRAAKTLASAEAALEHMTPKDRCSALQILASSFKSAGNLSAAEKMAKSCRDTVPLVKETYERSKALGEAIDASAAAGDFDAAIELVQSQADNFAYCEYVECVAVPLAEAGAIERLIEPMSKSQGGDWIVEKAIAVAARKLTDRGFVADAKRLAGLLRGYPYQGFAHICESLVRKGDVEGCLSTLGEIGLRSRQELMADLTGFSRWLGRRNLAVDWLLRNTALRRYECMAGEGRLNALKEILFALRGKITAHDAPALAHRLIALVAIEPGIASIRARAEVAGWLAELGACDAAVHLARKIRDEVYTQPISRDKRMVVATALGAARKWDEAYAVLEPLFSIGGSGNVGQSDEIRVRAAEALARSKKYDAALAQCDQIKYQAVRAYGLAMVAAELVGADADRAKAITSHALDLVHRHNSDEEQKSAYSAIAFNFARRGRAQEAQLAASSLGKSARDDALRTVVYLLLKSGAVDGAEAAALAISDWSRQRDALLLVMRTLLKDQQYERAFATATRFPYVGYRFDALAEWIEVVLEKRPPHERNIWLKKAVAAGEGDSGAKSLEFRGRLGRAVLKAGDRLGAETILADTLALAGNPTELAKVYARLASACVDRHPEDARFIVSRLLTSESSTKDAALALAQLGEWEQFAVKIRQTSGRARVGLLLAVGETAAGRGIEDETSECLGQLNDTLAGIADVEQPAALTEAACLCWVLGDANRARELCQKAYRQMAQSPNSADLHTIAVSIARAGQKDLALQCLAGGPGPVRPWEQALIGEALANSGAYDEAADLAQAVLANLGADHDFWDEMARQKSANALATAGRPHLALKVASQIDNPVHKAEALIHLARNHQKAGRECQCENALSQAFAAIAGAETPSMATLRAEAAALLFGLGRLSQGRTELIAAFEHAVGAGAEAFVNIMGAGAPVLAADLRDGEVRDLINRLERAATVLRDSRNPTVMAETPNGHPALIADKRIDFV